MSRENEIRNHNMDYLGLSDEQYTRHEKLMKTKMNEWPMELYFYVANESKKYGMSGDAIAVWVAEWIRQNDNETH